MSQPAAGQALPVQQTSAAVQQSNSWEEILQEFRERYWRASEMNQFQYLVGQKHRNKPYEQVYADQGYVRWVKAHVKEAEATREQLQFLHYVQLREREAGAAAVILSLPQHPRHKCGTRRLWGVGRRGCRSGNSPCRSKWAG